MDVQEFRNRSLMDWTNPINVAGIRAAINAFPLDRNYPALIGGRLFGEAPEWFASVDPNTPEHVVGNFPLYGGKIKHFDLSEIHNAWLHWSIEYPWMTRVAIIRHVARLINERFLYYCAALVIEIGKSWAEADGEVAEAEDFARWDALIAEKYFSVRPPATPHGVSAYNGVMAVPHGTFVILIPYNFPLAIGLDMAAKALLAGNAVVICPSNKAATTGWLLYELLTDAFRASGVDPKGIVNFAPTAPEDGHAMVHALLGDPYVSGLCFTGSAVVLDTLKVNYGAMKRWNGGTLRIGAAETSGVNALYVDRSSDIAAASKNIARSFLGISGQKCSSVRRVIAHKDIADALFAFTVEEVDKAVYGDTKEGAQLGAMISPEAVRKLGSDIAVFGDVVRVGYTKQIALRSSFDFAPCILHAKKDVLRNPKKLSALGNTEFFGPVCTFITVPDFSEAERVFNASDFALTGGIWSNDPAQIRRAVLSWRAGNFYVNRKITGAFVGSEQFGGLLSRSSETGIPTGPHALAFFCSVKTISGNHPDDDPIDSFNFARELDGFVSFGKY